VAGSDEAKRLAFVETLRMLRLRLEPFSQLPPAALDRLVQEKRVEPNKGT
jgi:hypothetical protein